MIGKCKLLPLNLPLVQGQDGEWVHQPQLPHPRLGGRHLTTGIFYCAALSKTRLAVVLAADHEQQRGAHGQQQREARGEGGGHGGLPVDRVLQFVTFTILEDCPYSLLLSPYLC